MGLKMSECKQNSLLTLSNPCSPLIPLAFMQVGIAQVSLDEHGRLDPLELSNWYPVSCLLSLQHRCPSQAQTVWFSPSSAGTQAAGDDGKEEPHIVTP